MSRKTPSIEELETASKVLGWLFEKYCRKINTNASPLEIHTISDKITRLSLVNDTILNERFIMQRDEKKEVTNDYSDKQWKDNHTYLHTTSSNN